MNAVILLFQSTGWKDEICFISFTICAVTLLLTVHKTQFQGRILLCYNKYFRFKMRNKICFKSRVVICPRAPVTMMFLDTRAYLEQICDLTPSSPHHTFVSSVGQAHKLLVAGLISYMHNKVCEEIKFASINIKK